MSLDNPNFPTPKTLKNLFSFIQSWRKNGEAGKRISAKVQEVVSIFSVS